MWLSPRVPAESRDPGAEEGPVVSLQVCASVHGEEHAASRHSGQAGIVHPRMQRDLQIQND